jgi:hypothetical protein
MSTKPTSITAFLGLDLIRDFGETAIDFALKHGAHGALRMTREEFAGLFRDAQENDIVSAFPEPVRRTYQEALMKPLVLPEDLLPDTP